jgi:hypothetical protein
MFNANNNFRPNERIASTSIKGRLRAKSSHMMLWIRSIKIEAYKGWIFGDLTWEDRA